MQARLGMGETRCNAPMKRMTPDCRSMNVQSAEVDAAVLYMNLHSVLETQCQNPHTVHMGAQIMAYVPRGR